MPKRKAVTTVEHKKKKLAKNQIKQTKNCVDLIQLIPDDVLELIWEFLSLSECAATARTCKLLHPFARQRLVHPTHADRMSQGHKMFAPYFDLFFSIPQGLRIRNAHVAEKDVTLFIHVNEEGDFARYGMQILLLLPFNNRLYPIIVLDLIRSFKQGSNQNTVQLFPVLFEDQLMRFSPETRALIEQYYSKLWHPDPQSDNNLIRTLTGILLELDSKLDGPTFYLYNRFHGRSQKKMARWSPTMFLRQGLQKEMKWKANVLFKHGQVRYFAAQYHIMLCSKLWPVKPDYDQHEEIIDMPDFYLVRDDDD
jgi:hypothetical protein